MSAATALAVVAACAALAAWARPRLVVRQARARLSAAPLRPAPPEPRPPAGLGVFGWVAGGALAERSAGEMAIAGAVGAAVVVGVVAAIGPVALVAGAVAGVTAPLALRSHRRAERRRLRGTQLPAALDRLATALRAGSPVPMALAEAGAALPAPVGPELVALGREADVGRAVADVLDGWSRRHDDPGTRLAATALALATTVGGAAGRAVDGVASTLRERLDLADERRSLAAQARLSALVLAVAPVGFAVLLGAADSSAADFLLGTPAGWVCLGVGLALDATGAWWMARLTRGPEA